MLLFVSLLLPSLFLSLSLSSAPSLVFSFFPWSWLHFASYVLWFRTLPLPIQSSTDTITFAPHTLTRLFHCSFSTLYFRSLSSFPNSFSSSLLSLIADILHPFLTVSLPALYSLISVIVSTSRPSLHKPVDTPSFPIAIQLEKPILASPLPTSIWQTPLPILSRIHRPSWQARTPPLLQPPQEGILLTATTDRSTAP